MATRISIPYAGWAPLACQVPIWQAMEADLSNILVVGHRRMGKDELLLADLSVRAARKPANYIYCLPETAHVRRAIWHAINPRTGIRRVEEHFPKGYRVGHLKDQEMAIDVKSADGKQSRIQFLGSDNYDAIVGMSAYGFYASEWALADPQALAMIRPILTENGGFFRAVTTPRGKNHVWKQLQGQMGKPDWGLWVLPADETGVFTLGQLQTVREEQMALYGPELGLALFQQEYLCSFETVAPGSYYADLLVRAASEGRIGGVLPVAGDPVYAACDLGWSDMTAIWYVQVHRDRTVSVLAYDEMRKKSIVEVLKVLQAYPWVYGAVLLPHDGAAHEVTSGETTEGILKRHGLPVQVMPRTNETAQIASVRQLLSRCTFNGTNCERGLTCLRAYHNVYKSDKDDWTPKAAHDWSSHGAKAFATLAYFADSLVRGAGAVGRASAQELDAGRRRGGGSEQWMM